MSTTLNGYDISGLIMENDITPIGVRSTVEKTLSGALVIWEQAEQAGRSFDLVGGSDFGWLTRATLLNLRSIASVPGATYTLIMEGITSTVRFRNEDAPAVTATPIIGRPNPDGADWYSDVVVKLMGL
jgi:hypothetical protein